ncbi:putative reverse transcriptase domain-containing protein [Tanacetum coccineum]|uniref:Reverse transcriptase domain-containing protein n=1 Tax=Tanacetum coccineum TaxID=301880 RepID=A0ABQ5DYJ2_9ASTR
MSKDHTHSGNKEDKTSITTMIHDTKRQMLEGKLVLVGDDGIPVKSLNVDGQASSMDHFPCMSNMFGTPNTTTKVATASTSYTPSNNAQDGSVNVIKSDKLNDTWSRSYANLLNCEQSKKVANFRTLTAPSGNAADVAISLESVLEVKDRFENSVYGFFSWQKKFVSSSSKLFMESMLDNGSWLIRNVPFILQKWSPLANVSKEDLKSVTVWLKLHDVPITTFTENELSVIATKLGNLLMLDTYTASMYIESRGRFSFMRSMIDLHVDVEFIDFLVVAMPKIHGNGYLFHFIRVEYH